jgi:hypothetical protein
LGVAAKVPGVRKFEYSIVTSSRDISKKDYPWGVWTLTYGLKSEELEIPDGKSVLNFLGEQGWELVGPPEITRMTGVWGAFNHTTGKKDHYVDWAQPIGYSYYFKRELDE